MVAQLSALTRVLSGRRRGIIKQMSRSHITYLSPKRWRVSDRVRKAGQGRERGRNVPATTLVITSSVEGFTQLRGVMSALSGTVPHSRPISFLFDNSLERFLAIDGWHELVVDKQARVNGDLTTCGWHGYLDRFCHRGEC
jgi:hypothetical protein